MEILRARQVSVSFDGWSSIAMKSFLGVVVRFFDPLTASTKQYCWDVIYLDDSSHTGRNLSTALRNSLPSEIKILSLCSDNAANAVKAVATVEDIPFHSRCLAHTLELICSKGIKYLENLDKHGEKKNPTQRNKSLITRLRRVIAHFQLSSSHKAALRKIQETHKDQLKIEKVEIIGKL